MAASDRLRLTLVLGFFGCLAAAAAGRLLVVQGVCRAAYLNPAGINYHRTYELPARKGELLDRRGRPLSRCIEAASVAANPHLVADPERTAAILAPALGLTRDELLEKLTRRWRKVLLRRDVSSAVERALSPLVERGILAFDADWGDPQFTVFVFPRQFHALPEEREQLATMLGRAPRELAALQGSAAECLPVAGGLDSVTAERIASLGLSGLLVQQDSRPATRSAWLRPVDAAVVVEPVRVVDDDGEKLAWTLTIRDGVWQALEPLWADTHAPTKSDVEARMRCRFVFLTRELPLSQGRAVDALIQERKLPGVFVHREYARYYPQGDTGRALLGRTDVDEHGLSGLEQMYNQVVTGVPGYRRVTVSASGRPIDQEREERVEPVHGKSVELTIDTVVQGYAEEAVRQVVADFQANWGLAVVADPVTGEILALVDIASDERQEQQLNRPMTLAFEPGSVIKPIVVAGALEEQVVEATDTFVCNGSMMVGRHRREGIKAHGSETVSEAVRDSCNMALVQIAQRMGQSRLQRCFGEFGLLGRTGLGLPGQEANGAIYASDLGGLWSPSKVATVSYGKGIQVSAVGLVRAYSALINGGTLPTLHLERRILDRDGNVIVERLAGPGPRVISPETAAQVRAMLRSVVADPQGTGKLAASRLYDVAGKTGTSIAYANQHERVVSFIGYAPFDAPRLICLVSAGEPRVGPRWGASTCGAAFRQIIERSLQYLGVAPTRSGEAAQ